MMEPIFATQPLMALPGNHEVEQDGALPATQTQFLAFNKRFKMPEGGNDNLYYSFEVASAHIIHLNSYDLLCMAFSFSACAVCACGKNVTCVCVCAHLYKCVCVCMRLPLYDYPPPRYMPFNETSKQYEWLMEDFRHVDRAKTPWLIVNMHAPWYNSNQHHHNEVRATHQT